MSGGIIGNAWANVSRRRVASMTIVVVVVGLLGGVIALLIPVRDIRSNELSKYQRAEWNRVFLVEGEGDNQVAELRKTAGVVAVTPFTVHVGQMPGSEMEVQVRNYVPQLELDIASGRLPASDRCEAVVTRDFPGAAVGRSLNLTLRPGQGGVHFSPVVVGIINRAYPMEGPTVITTCPLPATSPPAELIVSTRGTSLPDRYVAQSLNEVARSWFASRASTGLLGLIAIVLAGLSLVVVASVARWGVRSRLGEFTTLRVWGSSRRAILGMVVVEQLMLLLVAAPAGVGVGTLLAWRLVRAGGPSSLVDPQSGIDVAIPSGGTMAMAVGGLTIALVMLTLLPAYRMASRDIVASLRRRGE